MSGSGGGALGVEALAAALDRLPDGVAVFDADWTIGYVNPAGAALLGRPARRAGRPQHLGRPARARRARSSTASCCTRAAPARRSPGRASTRPPTGGCRPPRCWPEVCCRSPSGPPTTGSRVAPPSCRSRSATTAPGTTLDRDRLRFLAEVSEAMIATLDTGESATRLAELVGRRACATGPWWRWSGTTAVPARRPSPTPTPPAGRTWTPTCAAGCASPPGTPPWSTRCSPGEPVQVPAINQEPIAPTLPTEEVRAAWRRLAATSCTIVPLRARGETFGALALMNAGEPAAADRDGHRHRGRGGPPGRPRAGQRPALRPAAQGRRDAAAQPAHPAAAARPPARSPSATARPPATSRSAGTGTTRSPARRRDRARHRRRRRAQRRRRGRDGADPQHPARASPTTGRRARPRCSTRVDGVLTGLGVGTHGHRAGRPPRAAARAGGGRGCARSAGPRPGTCRRCCSPRRRRWTR